MSSCEPGTGAAAMVRASSCGVCGAAAGRRCTPDGDHLARWLAAYRAGAVSRAQLTEVISGLVVITAASLIPGGAA